MCKLHKSVCSGCTINIIKLFAALFFAHLVSRGQSYTVEKWRDEHFLP